MTEEEVSMENYQNTDASEPDFSSMSKEELVKFMEAHVDVGNPLDYNSQVSRAREVMESIVDKEQKEALDKFMEEGNDRIDFVPPSDELKDRFFKAFNDFRKRKNEILEQRSKKLEENLKIKQGIIEELKKITEAEEMAPNQKKVRDLQEKWKNTGPVPATYAQSINQTYHFYLKKFFNTLNLYGQFIELDRKKNLEKKENLCKKAEALQEENDLENARHKLKRIEDDWKKTGPVLKEEEENIETRFKNALTRFYSLLEAEREKQEQKREENYQKKEEILKKVQTFPDFDSGNIQDWISKDEELSNLLDQFYAIGPAPANKFRPQKEALKKAVRTFRKNKNEFFKKLKKEKAENLEKKKKYIEEVEALLNEESLNPYKDRVIQLQKEWKQIYPVPRGKAKELNEKFEKACNQFFEKLTEENQSLHQEYDQNIKEREDMIKEVQEREAPANYEEARKLVEELREGWNQKGEVPAKVHKALNKKFFNALKDLLRPIEDEEKGSADILLYQIQMEEIAGQEDAEDRIDQEVRNLNRKLKEAKEEKIKLDDNLAMLSGNQGVAGQLRKDYEERLEKIEKDIESLAKKLRLVRKLEKQITQ